MTSTETFTVGLSTLAVRIEGSPAEGAKTLTSFGPDTLSYYTTDPARGGSVTGTLTTGQSLTLTGTVWLTSAGRTTVQATASNLTDSRIDSSDPLRLPGLWAPFLPTTSLAVTASRCYYLRFVPTKTRTISAIAFLLQTTDANNDTVDVGICDSSLNRLVSSGATAAKLNAASFTAPSISITPQVVATGTVYFAAICIGTAAAPPTLASYNTGSAATAHAFDAVAGTLDSTAWALIKDGITAIPASSTFASTAATSNVPALALRET